MGKLVIRRGPGKRYSFARDDRGQILILTALSMTVLLGIAALSIDASYMYDKRNRLYAAADAAAKSAAIELHRGNTTNLQTFANQQVTAHGFDPSGTTTVVVHNPPTSGPFTANASYVEVIVSEPTSTFFGTVLGFASMTPGARAVAGASNPLNCLTTQGDPSGSPASLELGNSQLTLSGCGVGVGGPPGSADLVGSNPNAAITGTPTPSVGVTGTCSGTCGAMGSLTTGAPQPLDPLAGLAAPTVTGACVAGVTAVLAPGCYSSISSAVTTLTTGVYKITGPVDIGSLTGTNVLLYLTGSGQFTSSNNKTLTLTAQTSGAYTGVAIFQDPTDTNNFSTGNSFTLNVSGAIYMPGADVDFPNGLTFVNSGCFLFLAKTLKIRNGSGTMSVSNCAASYGGAAFLSVSIAE